MAIRPLLLHQESSNRRRLDRWMTGSRISGPDPSFDERVSDSVRIVPVFGPDALSVSPRAGHLHVRVDDASWVWADASGNLFARGLYLDDSRLPVRGRLQERFFHERRCSTLPLSQATVPHAQPAEALPGLHRLSMARPRSKAAGESDPGIVGRTASSGRHRCAAMDPDRRNLSATVTQTGSS
jgi:hypothetical protein